MSVLLGNSQSAMFILAFQVSLCLLGTLVDCNWRFRCQFQSAVYGSLYAQLTFHKRNVSLGVISWGRVLHFYVLFQKEFARSGLWAGGLTSVTMVVRNDIDFATPNYVNM
ncbi:uncharacterized protein B0T23DRAFT_209851 [Neurospora hispaniola]|uniref:Uncharacterized protein n=1 Tax=Neurospora hispaniola TaxID=588809 RepID=A0AAJ0I237_9PEZI|nr:hypothetical protein B0T23DRAFT_209851 [Neurospora hispaniola]